MSTENLAEKHNIISAAINLKINQEKPFTIKQLSRKAGVKEDDIYLHFNSITHILPAFYLLLPDRYLEMTREIDGYADFSLEEQLSNFIYSLFDMLQEEREFVDQTIAEAVFTEQNQEFKQRLGELMADFLENDPQIAASTRALVSNKTVSTWLAGELIHLLKFWHRDKSPQYQNSLALTDKLVAFLSEALHSQAIDRGLDLLKYMAGQGLIKFSLLNWLLKR